MTRSRTFLFATNNRDKFDDLGLVFKRLGIGLKQVPLEVKEGADSLLENARLKAVETSKKYPGEVVIASDGGVIIPYLGDNWNYVLTKRLGGLDMDENFNERRRAEAMLELMKDAKGKDRKIFWRGAVVLAQDGQVIWSKVLEGTGGYLMESLPKKFDSRGFWLGYIWYVPEAKTYYMDIPVEKRFKYSSFKQRLYRGLEGIIK